MGSDGDGGGGPAAAQLRARRAAKGKAARLVPAGDPNTIKRVQRDAAPSSSSSSSSRQQQPNGVRLRSRRRSSAVVSPFRRDDDRLQGLALPLGMSFAAIVAQFLDGKKLRENIPVGHLSRICTSAVEESVTNLYGDRFGYFMKNFEKSFDSTLRTLILINEASIEEHANTSGSRKSSCSATAPIRGTPEFLGNFEESRENISLSLINNQIIPYGQTNQQLVHVSQSKSSSGFNQSILGAFERSVLEQTRSNDLKAVEIDLAVKRLQLKQSQLALSSYSNMLEKVKISMGIAKASFKEDKLKNQMQDLRYSELIRRCIDLLVTSLIIMCSFLLYGASIFSYNRIKEATLSCNSLPKDSKSWWMPKQMATFSSGWLTLRCHAVVLTRMSFGFLMILAIAYSVFQRSAVAGPTMPVTFILLLLGAACGVAGKLCVDTLGGNGYFWLVWWEVLCTLHFFANVFPATSYRILYGPLSVSQEVKAVRLPYWVRRYTFYGILLVILPLLSGLLPFASVTEWREHFSQKISQWSLGDGDELFKTLEM